MWFIKKIFSGIAVSESKNSFLYFLTSVINAAIGIITLPIYTTYLTPSEFGIWGIIIAINTFLLPIFQLGLNSFFIKENYSNSENNKDLFSTLLFFTLIWSGLLILVGTIVGPFLFDLSGIKIDFFPFMFIILVSNLSVCCFTYLPLKYRIEGDALKYSLVLITKAVLITIVSLSLVITFKLGIEGRIYGFTVGNLLFVIFCIPFLRRYLTFNIRYELIILGVRKCLPLVPAVLATLLFDTIDRLLMEHYMPLEKVGFYNVAAQFAAMFTMGYLSIFKAVEPKIFKLSSTKSYKEIDSLFISIFVILGVAGLLCILLAKPILNVLIKESFYESIPVARWLILVVFTQGIYLTLSTYNVSLSRNRNVMYIAIAGLIMFIAGLKFLIVDYGIFGVAISKALVFLIMSVIMWLTTERPMKILKVITIAILEFIVLGGVITLI